MLIDADSNLAARLRKLVHGHGRWLHHFRGVPSIEEVEERRPNAVILDLRVFGSDAWFFLERLVERLAEAAVVVCTGDSSVEQRLCGLSLGADDWITKPCDPREILARAEAVTRRRARRSLPRSGRALSDEDLISVGELELRESQYQAFVRSRSVDLTPREFMILHALARRRGQILARRDLYEIVWGHTMPHGDRAIDVFVKRIRVKLLHASPTWRYIHTHARVGYRFEPEPSGEGKTD